MNFLLFLIFALLNGVLVLYPILRYAPIRDNWCKRGPSIRFGKIFFLSIGREFPQNPNRLWLKALDCYGSLLLVEYLVLYSFIFPGTSAVLFLRQVSRVGSRLPLVPRNLFSDSIRLAHSNGSNRAPKRGKNLDENSKSFESLIEHSIKRFNGMLFRKEGRPLVGYLKSNLLWVGGRLTRSRCALLVIFARMCYRIVKSEGKKGLVLYLKTSYVLIQQSIAGYIVDDLTPLKRRVRRARTGLPLWIPVQQRILLMKGDIPTIRFWTSLCSIYRIIKYPGTLNLNSITDPGVDWIKHVSESPIDSQCFQEVISIFWHKVGGSSLRERWINTRFDFFPIGKSSPQSSILWTKRVTVGAISTNVDVIRASAYFLWVNFYDTIVDSMQVFAADTRGFFEFFSLLRRSHITDFIDSSSAWSPYVGKLGLKDEPAGKIRVFAMVDCWTQWLMHPLHKLLQDVLRLLDTDATFDQVGSVERKIQQLSKRYRRPKAFSFDLSSATDRLPVGLQVSILQPLLGKYESKAWADILVGRAYKLPHRASQLFNKYHEVNSPHIHYTCREVYERENCIWSGELDLGGMPTNLRSRYKTSCPESVRYAVGQPMGALSSWVMLAVTHHIVVQWAAMRCGHLGWKRWFDEYIVLGDDVVIFNPHVASHYYLIMTQILGVQIGLAKSITARKRYVLEFAKKLWVDGERAFVVPLRDAIVATLSTETMNEFMRKHNQPLNAYLGMRGLGYKARSKWLADLWNLPSRLRVYLVTYSYSNKEFMDWVTMKSLRTNYEVTRTGIERFITTLENQRTELIAKLEQKPMLDLEKVSEYMKMPFYQASDLHEEILKLHGFANLLNSLRLRPRPTLSILNIYQLRDLLWEIKLDIDHLRDEADRLSSLTFLSSVRGETRPFTTWSTLYSDWVRYQACFAETQAGVPFTDEDATKDYINSPEPPEIFISKHVGEEFFDAWFPDRSTLWVIARIGIYDWFFRCFRTAAIVGLLLYMYEVGWSNEEDLSSLPAPYPDPPLGSEDDGPGLLGWIGVLVLGWAGSILLVLLLLWLSSLSIPLEFEDLSIISNRFLEIQEWEAASERVLRESLAPLGDPIVTRSPQIGHGWSEPWSFNPDWPENWR